MLEVLKKMLNLSLFVLTALLSFGLSQNTQDRTPILRQAGE